MKYKSAMVTSASGSVGGMTASHNRSGLYMRARRVPTNPNTTFQQDSRNSLAAASANWRSLTEAQRVAWTAYAAATPVTNALGDSITLSGQQAYVATVALATQIGGDLGDYDTAPTSPGRVPIGTPVPVLDASASTIVISGMGPDVGHCGVFIGDPLSEGVSFFKGPYQLRGHNDPVAGTLTINAASGRNGAAFVAGQLLPIRIRGIDGTGRLSTVYESIVTVVA